MTPVISAAQTGPPFATAFDHAEPPAVRHPLRRAAGFVTDVFGLVGVALFAPLGILALGIPIALIARGLLWMIGGF